MIKLIKYAILTIIIISSKTTYSQETLFDSVNRTNKVLIEYNKAIDRLEIEKYNDSVSEPIKHKQSAAKSRERSNFTVSDILGPSLNNDPNYRREKAAQADRASQDAIGTTSVVAPTVEFLKYDKEVYDKYLKPGQHYGTPEELDKRVEEAMLDEKRQYTLISIGIIVLIIFSINRFNKPKRKLL